MPRVRASAPTLIHLNDSGAEDISFVHNQRTLILEKESETARDGNERMNARKWARQCA